MSEFKWRQFEDEIILWAVRWYCRYCISYRDLEQMMDVPLKPLSPSGKHIHQG
jgi:transposase-like protein